MRGTKHTMVGRISFRLGIAASMDSEYEMDTPAVIITYVTRRSNTCESGSTERYTSLELTLKASRFMRTLLMKFLCVRITPLGSPVVPDVYTILAQSVGDT